MTHPQYHTRRPDVARRDYADASGSRSGASGRVCARCGARLRRGNTDYSELCAPCAAATLGLISPAAVTACPDCGGPKKRHSKRCIRCANTARWHPGEEMP
jgi:hypothetical protein